MRSLLTALFCAMVLGAQPSQPPSQTKPIVRDHQEQQGRAQQHVGNPADHSANDISSLADKVIAEIDRKQKQGKASSSDDSAPPNYGGVTDWLLFLVAALQAFIYWRQTTVMEKALGEAKRAADAANNSATISNDALILSQRAIIAVSPSIDHFGDEGERYDVSIKIVNIGNTPALNVRSYMHLQAFIGPDFPAPEILPRNSMGPPAVVYPRINNDFRIGSHGDIQTADFIEKVKSGEWRIYVWGRIEYDTILPTPRFVNFCFHTIHEPWVMLTTSADGNDCN